MNRTLRRRPSMPTCAWAWAVVLLLLVQAAVPLLASTAATRQGVSLVEICSIYGVQTVQVDADGSTVASDKAPMPGHHAGGFECALTPLLASVGLAATPPAVLLHAPQQAIATVLAPAPIPPSDATQRWLAARLHAPPSSV